MQNATITIQMVKGGYVVTSPTTVKTTAEVFTTTEVFTSTAKMLRAVRGSVDEFTLVPKKSADKDED